MLVDMPACPLCGQPTHSHCDGRVCGMFKCLVCRIVGHVGNPERHVKMIGSA